MSDYMRNRRGEESDSFFCRFTFGQFFALLVLEVFSLFFVFYLGARYGREFLGLDKTAVAIDAGAIQPEGETSEPKVATTADAGSAELARELVAKAKTPELKDRIAKMFEGASRDSGASSEPAPEAKAPQAPVAEAPTVEAASSTVLQAETQAAPTAAPADGSSADQVGRATSDERRATETSQSDASGVVRVKSVENARYSVQVGSYPKMDEATRSVEKWKGKGYPAYVMIANIPDRGQWYRVRIGGFTSRDEAANYMADFKSRENAEALVVMNEQ